MGDDRVSLDLGLHWHGLRSNNERKVEMAEEPRPMVTREEYEQGRAVLDALPPGIYMKCAGCAKWSRGGTINFRGSDVVCGRCA